MKKVHNIDKKPWYIIFLHLHKPPNHIAYWYKDDFFNNSDLGFVKEL